MGYTPNNTPLISPSSKYPPSTQRRVMMRLFQLNSIPEVVCNGRTPVRLTQQSSKLSTQRDPTSPRRKKVSRLKEVACRSFLGDVQFGKEPAIKVGCPFSHAHASRTYACSFLGSRVSPTNFGRQNSPHRCFGLGSLIGTK